MDKKLFQPIRIRGMELKNRIAFAPLLMVGDGDGSYVGDKMIRWHEARARGGTGLIMMGAVIVSSAFKRGVVPGRVEVSFYDDKFIPGFARLAEVVHSYGTKIGVQLACVGPLGGVGPSHHPTQMRPTARWAPVRQSPVWPYRFTNSPLKRLS